MEVIKYACIGFVYFCCFVSFLVFLADVEDDRGGAALKNFNTPEDDSSGNDDSSGD